MNYLLQFCNEYAVPKDKLENFRDVTAKDIVCSQVPNHIREYSLLISN